MTTYSLEHRYSSFFNLEPVCCFMFGSNRCFLTCIQISQEARNVVWYIHLFKNFTQFVVIHTVKGIGIVTTAEVEVFLELFCFFDDPTDVGNLISGSSAFSKSNSNIWKFMVHILLKPGLEKFEHYFTSVWDECNCAVVWASFVIAFLWDWNENWPFPVQYAGQEATVRTGHVTTDWFQIRKGVRQGCISSPCLFNLHAEYNMRKWWAGWSTSWNQDCREKYQ